MASIQVIQGPDKGRTFELIDGDNVVGREGRPVILSDKTASRAHARLIFSDGRWVLEDLGSGNGTFLNGVRVKAATPVKRGDQLRCGSTLLVFLGGPPGVRTSVDVDENGRLVDAAIVATMPSSEDSVIIPTPEAGAEAIGNLRILYDLIADVGSILNIDLLLGRTLDKAFDTLKAERGYILLIDDNGKLILKASRVSEDSLSKDIPISRTIIDEVVKKQMGVLSNNAMSDKRFAAGKSVHNLGIRSAICVPIKGRDKILGIIHIDCSVSEHNYTTEQLRLLTAVGYQTGLAIENVRLYESAIQSERLAAVGETTALLSHHIKNILQALGAGADVVEMGLNGNNLPKAKQAWPIVQRNLRRINELILNMLTFSKAREPHFGNVNVNRMLSECIELETPRADEQRVAVMSDLDDLPVIPGDEAGLHQAFLNLLSNAIDAVPDDTGIVTVASTYDSMNRKVIVKVIDNGTGIERDEVDRIFNPFFSSKGQGGTGLGLAVARKVVEEHRGRIDVSSKAGEGCTFTITLPALFPEDTDAGTTESLRA
ncbi:MAG TPA: ATP-binding protein [Phycisphaerae bacterium]|nr:ATP-binding protein [Phycisphaerae bacterium]